MRLIGETPAETFGVLDLAEARRIAAEHNMDLVEVAPDAAPPVCRLMDLGKQKYKQKKRQQEQKKKQHTVELKEIWLRPRIEAHDLNVKTSKAREFLEMGFRVALTMKFRSREILHKEIGVKVLDEMSELLKDVGKKETQDLKPENRRMQVVMAPVKTKKG